MCVCAQTEASGEAKTGRKAGNGAARPVPALNRSCSAMQSWVQFQRGVDMIPADAADRIRVAVLECVAALDQLHATLKFELGRRSR